MFDFLAKLFSTSDSKTPKPSSTTSSNKSSTHGIASPVVGQEAQGKDKKMLEQERQAWRQKLDAAAQNESIVLELLFSCDHADGRLHAAHYLQTVAALEKAKLHFKKSDQRIVKFVQARLDQIKQQDRIVQAGQDCISQAQALLKADVVLPNQLAQLDQARSKLDQLGEVPSDVVKTFEPLRQQLETRIQEQVLLQRSLIDLLAQLKTSIDTESALNADVWHALKLKMQELSLARAASSLPKSLLRESEELIKRGDAKLLEQTKFQDQKQEATMPEVVTQLEANPVASQPEDVLLTSSEVVDATPEIKQATKQRFVLDHQGFITALEGLEKALQDGRSQQARQFEKDLHALDLNHAPAYINKHLRQRLIAARKECAHLMSWARWSGVASREELVNTAEGLAQLRLGPKEIVDTVTALRAQWKQIEEAGGAGSKELWSRFDAACSAAYAPAGAHFQEQAQTRKDNTVKAREMLGKVTEKVSALLMETTDWRAVANALAQVRQDWRRVGMMDRKEKQTLDRELDAVLEPLEHALRAQRELAQQERNNLIADAQKIDASQRDAVEAVRQLQHRWQQSAARVPLERHLEQELWHAFRAACDQVFSAKKVQHESEEQERFQHLQQKQSICTAIDQVLTQGDMGRADLACHLKEFELQWRNIGPVPRQDEKRVEKLFQESMAALKQRIDQHDQQDRLAYLEQIRQSLKECFYVETGAVALESLNGYHFGGKDMCSKNLQQRLSAVRAAMSSNSDGVKFSEQTSTIAQAILQLEILWELESPSTEQEQRRQAQLLMLQHSLKHGRDPNLQPSLFAKVIATPCAPTESMQTRILAIFDKGCTQWL